MSSPSPLPTPAPVVAPPNAQLTTNPTEATLNGYLKKNINKICEFEYTNDDDNHCAHFVSHVMGFNFGYTCKSQTGKGPKDKKGASIRVHQLFAQCPSVGEWDSADRPTTGLAFITAKNNVKLATKYMANVPRKHVGIFINNTVWHYSNTKDEVVSQDISAFKKHYSGTQYAVFWGTFPK